jgi:hypothetical protein
MIPLLPMPVIPIAKRGHMTVSDSFHNYNNSYLKLFWNLDQQILGTEIKQSLYCICNAFYFGMYEGGEVVSVLRPISLQ